ncbi:hypothetical protein KY285_000666 [Solanum tuberosum]|nr:hypothetical protein KY285_000666 [Solanum tuberosum]
MVHIEIEVKGQCAMEMTNVRATHTFVDVMFAAKLGHKLIKSPSYIKTINLKGQSTMGMANGVPLTTENWFVPFPHLDGVMIMSEGNPGFVKGVYSFGKVGKVAKKNKGLRMGDETILVALVELKLYVKVEGWV